MAAISLSEHPRHTDRLRLRDGKTLTVRFVGADEGEALQRYFRQLSMQSRHSRFLGAMSELSASELGHFIHVGENDRFSVVAVMMIEGREIIIGEARYGFDSAAASFEFGISIDDRWQGQGIGSALARQSGMPGGRAGRAPHVRRHITFQRGDDLAGPQVGLCFHPPPRRLEARALRKADGPDTPGHSLRKLEACGRAARSGDGGVNAFVIPGCAVRRRPGIYRAVEFLGRWIPGSLVLLAARNDSEKQFQKNCPIQNFSTQGRNSSSQVQALLGCCSTFQ